MPSHRCACSTISQDRHISSTLAIFVSRTQEASPEHYMPSKMFSMFPQLFSKLFVYLYTIAFPPKKYGMFLDGNSFTSYATETVFILNMTTIPLCTWSRHMLNVYFPEIHPTQWKKHTKTFAPKHLISQQTPTTRLGSGLIQHNQLQLPLAITSSQTKKSFITRWNNTQHFLWKRSLPV